MSDKRVQPMRLTRDQVRQIIDNTSCGTCSMCCKILEIKAEPEKDFDYKPWNTFCKHCKPGSFPGGCTRHDDQPEACSIFTCVWLQSHQRSDVPSLHPKLKPSNSKVILVQSQQDYNVLFAFCDPSYPTRWREEPMRSHLIGVAESGCTVIVVVHRKRYLMTKGRATIEMHEDQLEELVGQNAMIKMNKDGHMQKAFKDEDSWLYSSVPPYTPIEASEKGSKNDK